MCYPPTHTVARTPSPPCPAFPVSSVRHPSLPPAPLARRPYVHVVSCITTPWRGTSRASIFRVKDGATDAIGPWRGLPRRVVVCGASHRSRLRPMRNPESQPLASRRPRPATYPTTAPTPLPATCSLAILARLPPPAKLPLPDSATFLPLLPARVSVLPPAVFFRHPLIYPLAPF